MGSGRLATARCPLRRIAVVDREASASFLGAAFPMRVRQLVLSGGSSIFRLSRLSLFNAHLRVHLGVTLWFFFFSIFFSFFKTFFFYGERTRKKALTFWATMRIQRTLMFLFSFLFLFICRSFFSFVFYDSAFSSWRLGVRSSSSSSSASFRRDAR